MPKRIADPSPPLPVPLARPLPPDEIAPFLRSLVGLPASDPTQGDDAAALVRGPSSPVSMVDASAWIAWGLAGLHACAVPSEITDGQAPHDPWVPSIRVMVSEARRAAIVIAMHRHRGNMTRAAKALGTSRRALRDALKGAGLYPWDAAPAIDTTSTTAVDSGDGHGGQA
jgi:Bacterial regulatory protein, Fis family